MTSSKENLTFANFLRDKSNDLAFRASVAVAKNPVYYINPLLIYGVHGCGKTHLLHAVENTVKAEFPHRSVLYTTAEEMVSIWISALKTTAHDNSLEVLCELYRNVDVLLIDHFQDVAGKSTTTELMMKFIGRRASELLQTIMVSNDSILSQRYIVDEFKMRFEGGLPAYVGMPGEKLKRRFVQSVAHELGAELDEYIVNYAASLRRASPAELRGVVQKVLLYGEVNHIMPTLYWLERNIR